jgi:hypothetical protein
LVDSLKKGQSSLNLNDPKLKQLIDALRARQRAGGDGLSLSDVDRETLKKFIPQGGALDQWLQSRAGEQSNPSQPGAQTNPSNASPPDTPGQSQGSPSNATPPDLSPATPAGGEAGGVTRWLLRLADRLKDNPGPLRDSPALKQALTDLGRFAAAATGSRPRGTRPGDDRGIKAPKFSDLLPGGERLAAAKPSWMPAWPSLPEIKLPRFNISLKGEPLPNGYGAQGRAFSGTGIPDGPGLAEVGVFGVCLAVLFVLVLGWRSKAGPGGAAGKLGPWPVRPDRVTTRLELIWAFEYLALRDLGPTAQSRNHRALAVGLGGQDGARRLAAAELSALYEKARYTPGEQPLAAETVAAARRALCFLAGVPAA